MGLMRLQTATMMLLCPPPSSPSLPLSFFFPLWELVAHESQRRSLCWSAVYTHIYHGRAWTNQFWFKIWSLPPPPLLSHPPPKGDRGQIIENSVVISIQRVSRWSWQPRTITTIVLLRQKRDKNTGHRTVTVVDWGGKTRHYACFLREQRISLSG